MQCSHSRELILRPLFDLVLIVEMEDLVEAAIARLLDIRQTAQDEMLDAAFLVSQSIHIHIQFDRDKLSERKDLGSINNIPPSIKLMSHISLCLDLLPGESVIRHSEHAIDTLKRFN